MTTVADPVFETIRVIAESNAERAPGPELCARFLAHPNISAAIAEIQSGIDRGLNSFSEGGSRMLPIVEHEGWECALVEARQDHRKVTSVPAPTAMYIVSAPARLRYERYEADRAIDADFLDQPVSLTRQADTDLRPGEWILLNSRRTAGRLVGTEPVSLLVRITGPAQSPVVAEFNPDDGEFSSLSLAGPVPTSQLFFTELMRSALAGTPFDEPWSADVEELESVRELFKRGMRDRSIHIATRWKIAQALAKTDGAAVHEFLAEAAASDSPQIRGKAERALQASARG